MKARRCLLYEFNNEGFNPPSSSGNSSTLTSPRESPTPEQGKLERYKMGFTPIVHQEMKKVKRKKEKKKKTN